ncbi:MAG: hypothetical protein HDR42_01970 [Lactobacillus sp.]|nr:hypothetical protein [Lactobacillus sp.]
MTKVDNSDLLDNTMKNIFDWSDDSNTVRENLWNYFLELSGKDPVRAEDKMGQLLNQENDKIKKFIEENLKK